MPTLEFRFLTGSPAVLTDATSVVLSDVTGTFGIKRTDTDAVIAADGTAMTHVATGVYTYAFTAPAPGLAYSWWAEVTYGGAVYRFEREFTDASAGVSIPGVYLADRGLLDAMFGPDQVTKQADYDSKGNAATIAAAISSAVLSAEAHVNDRFRGSRYAIPLAPVNETVKRWAAKLAYVELYRGRGMRGDTDSKQAGKFTDLAKTVDAEIDYYLADTRTGPWGLSTMFGAGGAPAVIDGNGYPTPTYGPPGNSDRRGDGWPMPPGWQRND